MKIQLWAILPLAFASATAMAQHNYSPAQGFVPDSASAVGVAAAIIRGIVGEGAAKSRSHLQATLSDSVWSVRATHGRVVLVELSQGDARVIRLQTSADGGQPTDFEPQNGFVGDSVIATAVAEMVLGAVYGRDRIALQLPLVASEADGVWTIRGQRPRGSVGGVAQIEVRRRDGAIVRVTHSR